MIEEFLNEFTGILGIYALTVWIAFLGIAFAPYIMQIPMFLLKGILCYLGVIA